MSAARIIRFVVGALIAAVLLGIVLPVVGVPSSRFLPPAHVWNVAKGFTRGIVTDKFYTETGNPFNVGAHIYHVDYVFGVKDDAGKLVPCPGQVTVSKEEYEAVPTPKGDTAAASAKSGEKVPVVSGQNVRVKYEPSAPAVNGVEAILIHGQWIAWGGRGTLGAAADFSGWLVWPVAALALGYAIMLVLERFGGRENI